MAAHNHSHIRPVRRNESSCRTSNNTTPETKPLALPAAVKTPLLRPEYPPNDTRCLPFVLDTGKGSKRQRCFWNCPPPQSQELDCETGMRFAAAYLTHRHLQKFDSIGNLLPFIIADMDLSSGNPLYWFAHGFLEFLEYFANSYANQQPSCRIAQEVEKRIERDRANLQAFRAALAANRKRSGRNS